MAIEKEGEEWKEYNSAVKWMLIAAGISIVLTIFFAIFSMPLAYLIGNGISRESLNDVSKFIAYAFQKDGFLQHRYWVWAKQLYNYNGPFSLSLWIPILPFIILPLGLTFGVVTNPYRFQSNIHGSARLATEHDVKKMGLFDGFCIVVGKFKGRLLRMNETLSVLCCAPPGTGKTVGVVMPTIFNSPGMSIVVNDPKPELCFSTSGARAKIGPVFIINWGMEDNPAEGIYYPSWNPLSPNAVPAQGPGRDMYVDSMCNTLVEEPKGGADPHWSIVVGFIFCLLARNQAKSQVTIVMAIVKSRTYMESFRHVQQ